MPQEKKESSTVDFLNNIDTVEVFKEEPTEEVKEEEDKKDEKPLAFHQDPKVQRYVEKQIKKALEGVKLAERQFREDVESDIKLPSSFIKLIGNDTPEKVEVLKDLEKYFGTLKGEARQEFLEEMKEQEQKQVAEDRAAVEELTTAFEEIEETYSVDLTSNTTAAQKLDNDFRAFIKKIAPKNADGEVAAFPDLISAFEEFQDRNKRPASASRAKELASRGLTRSTDASTEVPKGRSWKDVDRFFDNLKK